ncbi:hypothetical protein WJX75_008482 [Coccomyxa subellipsoidea]|uniref:Aldo/keto reductase n=1 Tax=Coccomyxa subellipsoidea TaxID=248742 RepID=A0ABR2YXK5_9CHLO
MAQPATRFSSPEPLKIDFFQAKLALEQQFLKDHDGADTSGIEGGALPAEEQKISSFATSQPTAVLNTGCRIPLIGLRLGTCKADEKTIHEALASALKAGYRHIDNHAAEDVRPALEATLGDLRTSYLDLYLIHWPVTEPQKKGVGIDPGIRETWTAMEELVDMLSELEEILRFCRICPSVNQVEVYPIWRNDELIAYCNDHDIHVTHGTSIIAKSSNPCHIKSNLEDVLNFELAKEDYDRISALDFQLRLVDGIGYLRPEGPYRTMKDLWDEDKTEAWRTRFIYKFPDMPTVQLSSGLHMPILGVGCTWLKQNVKDTVKFALRSGFRHIDVSSQRGNEAQIGAALLEVFADWIVQRRDVWVTGKVWHNGTACPSPSQVRCQVCKMLAALNVDYLDLCLLPAHNNMTAFKAAWTTMEALVDEGKLRSIGLQDASIEQLAEVMGSARILPVINSVEIHPGNSNDALLAFCRRQGVHVMASSWLATANLLQDNVLALLRNPLVTNIARSTGKRPAQVLIRWALQHGTSISPKADSPEHVQDILDVLNWELSVDDYRALARLPSETTSADFASVRRSRGIPQKRPRQQDLTPMLLSATKANLDKCVADFFYATATPLHVSRSPHFKSMLEKISLSKGVYRGPAYNALRTDLLSGAVTRLNKQLEPFFEHAKRVTGFVLLCDGWTDVQGADKDGKFIFERLSYVFEEIGPEHINCVNMDGASANESANKLLEEKYPHVFTLHCTAHALDLALEKFGNLEPFKTAVERAKKVVQLITNSHSPRAIFNSKSQLSLLKPGDTHSYTAYISCSRLLKCKGAARQTVVSSEWDRWAKKAGNAAKAATAKDTILDETFWADVRMFCELLQPIVSLMRLVDSNMPSMGKVYPMCAQIEAHISSLGMEPGLKAAVAAVFRERWNKMHSPLHGAAYMLEPQFRAATFDAQISTYQFWNQEGYEVGALALVAQKDKAM